MKLIEFVTPEEASTGYYDPAQDKSTKRMPDDTRKARVQLRDLNRLKKMRAQKKLENLKREDLLSIMYGAPDDESAGGPPSF